MKDTGDLTDFFYTSSPLIQAMINLVKPRIGETVYDPACGSGSLLLNASQYISYEDNLSAIEQRNLHQHTFFGRELNIDAFHIAQQSFADAGLNSENLWQGNTLLSQFKPAQAHFPKQFDVVLVNPPAGKHGSDEEQMGFEVKSQHIELLFLQHIIDSLKIGGRCAVLLPRNVIANTSQEFRKVKQKLLNTCKIEKIIQLDRGITSQTSIIFYLVYFIKGDTTQTYEYEIRNKIYKNSLKDAQRNNYNLIPLADAPLTELEISKSYPIASSPPYQIFISYRRADSSWVAGRLYDNLSLQLKRSIFLDTNSIDPGDDFKEEIKKALASCVVFIAVIGETWLKTVDEKGENRLFLAEDFVRLEIDIAIKNKIKIIPILVDDTTMPRAEQIPEELQKLIEIQALELKHNSFAANVQKLIELIEKKLPKHK